MHLCGAGHVCMYRGGVGPVGDERTTTARYKSRMQPHFDTDMIFLVDVGCARQQAGSCTHDELRHRHTYRHKRGSLLLSTFGGLFASVVQSRWRLSSRYISVATQACTRVTWIINTQEYMIDIKRFQR